MHADRRCRQMAGCEIELPSNSGRNSTKLRFRRTEDEPDGVVLYADIELTGQFWLPACDPNPRALEDSYKIYLSSVPIKEASLWKLADSLLAWLDKPRELCHDVGVPHRRFQISLGVEPGILCSADKPVARVEIAAPNVLVNSHYVVDQTCIRLFYDGLAGWL